MLIETLTITENDKRILIETFGNLWQLNIFSLLNFGNHGMAKNSK